DEPASAGRPAGIQLEPRPADERDGREPGSPPWCGPGRAGYAVATASAGGDRLGGRRGRRAGGRGRGGVAEAPLGAPGVGGQATSGRLGWVDRVRWRGSG